MHDKKVTETVIEAAAPTDYYTSRSTELLRDFCHKASGWRRVLHDRYGKDLAKQIIQEAEGAFVALIPQIPYIGGDNNRLTGALISAAMDLALYRAMTTHQKSPYETGKVLYDAIVAAPPPPPIPPSERLTPEQLMQRRQADAERSQRREYAMDFVYELVEGDGVTFDYGYNFFECATQKFYRQQHAEEFLPYHCFLDYPKGERVGLGLRRRETLAQGGDKCDHRFIEGGKADQTWPPDFARDSVKGDER